MAVEASFIDDWLLVENDVQLRTRKRFETDTVNNIVRGWLEQADESLLQLKRHFVGLTSFSDEAGDEKVSFTYDIGNGTSMTFSRPGMAGSSNKYICTRDKINIEDHVDGKGWEHQTWQKIGKYTMVTGSYYEEDLPETGTAYDDGTAPP